jgi:hypothetical protein
MALEPGEYFEDRVVRWSLLSVAGTLLTAEMGSGILNDVFVKQDGLPLRGSVIGMAAMTLAGMGVQKVRQFNSQHNGFEKLADKMARDAMRPPQPQAEVIRYPGVVGQDLRPAA